MTSQIIALNPGPCLVRVGAAHECVACGAVIARGDTAVRKSRRAETYRERCHADGRGRVSWYWHQDCAPTQ